VLDRQGRYQPIPIGDDERYQSTVIPDFWLSLAWLQAEAMPDPLLTLAEIAGFPPEVIETLRQIAARGPG
jgi:hypothetical protein